MTGFRFTREAINQHVETIGIDVRPPIEVKADRLKIQDFYNRVSDGYPKLFESLV